MEAVFIIALILLVIVLAAVFAGKRQRDLEDLAKRHGWSFHAAHWPDEEPRSFWQRLFPRSRPLEPVFGDFDVFSRGSDRKAKHTMRGVLELPLGGASCRVPMMAGDFEYTTGSGKNQSTHNFSYLLIQLPFAQVPGLVIRPQNVLDGIAAFFGFADISFESEEFSRTFHVSGADRRFAYDLCDPRMMQFLLSTRPLKFELVGRHLLVSDGSRTWSPFEFEQQVGWACEFARWWPRHVVDQLMRDTTAGRAGIEALEEMGGGDSRQGGDAGQGGDDAGDGGSSGGGRRLGAAAASLGPLQGGWSGGGNQPSGR